MGAEVLSLEHPRIRGLLSKLPVYAEGQPISIIRLKDIPPDISGYWSLWRINMHSSDRHRQKIMPLFLHDDGRNLQPTARYLWDQLNIEQWYMRGEIVGDEACDILERCKQAAIEQGQEIYLELRQNHLNQIQLEIEKSEYSFKVRRRLLESVGLEQVKNYRLRQLGKEEALLKGQLERQKQVLPELIPLLIVRIG